MATLPLSGLDLDREGEGKGKATPHLPDFLATPVICIMIDRNNNRKHMHAILSITFTLLTLSRLHDTHLSLPATNFGRQDTADINGLTPMLTYC